MSRQSIIMPFVLATVWLSPFVLFWSVGLLLFGPRDPVHKNFTNILSSRWKFPLKSSYDWYVKILLVYRSIPLRFLLLVPRLITLRIARTGKISYEKMYKLWSIRLFTCEQRQLIWYHNRHCTQSATHFYYYQTT